MASGASGYWRETLPLAPPLPPNLRARALAWQSERAQHEWEDQRIPALRGIVIAAAHPAWGLSPEERAMLRAAVERSAKTDPQNLRTTVVAFEALDALVSRYEVDVWRMLPADPRAMAGYSTSALARAASTLERAVGMDARACVRAAAKKIDR